MYRGGVGAPCGGLAAGSAGSEGAPATGGTAESAQATNDLNVVSQLTHAVGKFSSEVNPDGVFAVGVSAWLCRLELALQSYFQADLNLINYGRSWHIVFHLLDERAQVYLSNQNVLAWHAFKEPLEHRFGWTPRQVKRAL